MGTKLHALVVGSSSGLGLEISQYLLEEGYWVFGASRSGTDIDHPRFTDLEVDVRSENSVASMFDLIGANAFGLNIIANCAGTMELAPIHEMSSEEFNSQWETNVYGAFLVLKYAYDFLIENETHIVHLCSLAGKKGYPQISGHCASKFGLRGLIESVRDEWKSLGVRLTNLYPGPVNTPLWNHINNEEHRGQMMDSEDFINAFDMVIKSAHHIHFPELSLMHKEGTY